MSHTFVLPSDATDHEIALRFELLKITGDKNRWYDYFAPTLLTLLRVTDPTERGAENWQSVVRVVFGN